MAFKSWQRAKPKLLEPVMAVEVVTPQDHLGGVIGDLRSRRGRVEGLEPRVNRRQSGRRPALRDVRLRHPGAHASQGPATFSMKFDRYEKVPDPLPRRSSTTKDPRNEPC